MGMMSDFPEHEGYPVGFVTRDGCDESSGLYRELEYPRDSDGDRTVKLIAAACDCGWRSPRFPASTGTQWWPSCIFASEVDDARVHALFKEHIEHVRRSQNADSKRAFDFAVGRALALGRGRTG